MRRSFCRSAHARKTGAPQPWTINAFQSYVVRKNIMMVGDVYNGPNLMHATLTAWPLLAFGCPSHAWGFVCCYVKWWWRSQPSRVGRPFTMRVLAVLDISSVLTELDAL